MQTVASLAERLDMTAQEALEKLRFMMMDVESVDSVLTDDQCDLLIDVDDDPTVAERVRQKRLDDEEKARKRTERLKAHSLLLALQDMVSSSVPPEDRSLPDYLVYSRRRYEDQTGHASIIKKLSKIV